MAPLLSFHMDVFGIKWLRKVDMPSNRETEFIPIMMSTSKLQLDIRSLKSVSLIRKVSAIKKIRHFPMKHVVYWIKTIVRKYEKRSAPAEIETVTEAIRIELFSVFFFTVNI